MIAGLHRLHVQTYSSCATGHIGFLSAHQTTSFRDKRNSRDINYHSFTDLGLLSRRRRRSRCEKVNSHRRTMHNGGKLLNLPGSLQKSCSNCVGPDRSFLGDFRTEIIAHMIPARYSSILDRVTSYPTFNTNYITDNRSKARFCVKRVRSDIKSGIYGRSEMESIESRCGIL